ncbi:MAG: hypothetical protein RUMPE_00540 [Eubacteriales bacterium SKADARSKE-1]|nr:hypothetical protein [Eubacteriales bacterium SKADARSKE-1]
MQYSYKTQGTCSKEIIIKTDGDKIQGVEFVGGCSGNTQAISSLVNGMKIKDVIEKCKNIDCGGRGTSCPDQLAKALEEITNK